MKLELEKIQDVVDRYEFAFKRMITIICDYEYSRTGANHYVAFFAERERNEQDGFVEDHTSVIEQQTEEICDRLHKLYEMKECIKKFKAL